MLWSTEQRTIIIYNPRADRWEGKSKVVKDVIDMYGGQKAQTWNQYLP